jgi:hypothetical protein
MPLNSQYDKNISTPNNTKAEINYEMFDSV